MATNKPPLGHYDYYAQAAEFSFAADSKNTSYRLGPEGTDVMPGTPHVPWEQFVIIKDAKMFWTHGQVYKFYSLEDMYAALAAALAEAKAYTDEEIRKALEDFRIDDAQIQEAIQAGVAESVAQSKTYTDNSLANLATINGQKLTNGGNIVIEQQQAGNNNPPLFTVDYETGELLVEYGEGKTYFFSVNDEGDLCVEYI